MWQRLLPSTRIVYLLTINDHRVMSFYYTVHLNQRYLITRILTRVYTVHCHDLYVKMIKEMHTFFSLIYSN